MYLRRRTPSSFRELNYRFTSRSVFLHEGVMVVVKCSVEHCPFQTEDVTEALAIALLSNHGLTHLAPPAAEPVRAPNKQGPKLERPKVDIGISIEEWNLFVCRWEVFRSGSGIDDASAPSQLFQCAGSNLGDSLLKANPNATSDSLHDFTRWHALARRHPSRHMCVTYRASPVTPGTQRAIS